MYERAPIWFSGAVALDVRRAEGVAAGLARQIHLEARVGELQPPPRHGLPVHGQRAAVRLAVEREASNRNIRSV
jgi:hypothetical protein